jgi:hypothetical protein
MAGAPRISGRQNFCATSHVSGNMKRDTKDRTALYTGRLREWPQGLYQYVSGWNEPAIFDPTGWLTMIKSDTYLQFDPSLLQWTKEEAFNASCSGWKWKKIL